jgi:signal transduction histidine kinase
LETSKLAAIGQLGAGIAHEINNPLTAILGNIQLLMMERSGAINEIMPVLNKMETSAIRCQEITKNLLRFSEAELESDFVEVDLNVVLQDAFSLTEQSLNAQQIETVWHLGEELPPMRGDPRQLMQVFFNLFTNARTAMEKGGILTISTRKTDSDWIETKVEDTGKGIPPEYLDRIFEPFFTTKDVWTNTGLGLSVVYRTVSDHGE